MYFPDQQEWRYADALDNTPGALAAAEAGAAQILWHEPIPSGGGVVWAVVRLGNPPIAVRTAIVKDIHGSQGNYSPHPTGVNTAYTLSAWDREELDKPPGERQTIVLDVSDPADGGGDVQHELVGLDLDAGDAVRYIPTGPASGVMLNPVKRFQVYGKKSAGEQTPGDGGRDDAHGHSIGRISFGPWMAGGVVGDEDTNANAVIYEADCWGNEVHHYEPSTATTTDNRVREWTFANVTGSAGDPDSLQWIDWTLTASAGQKLEVKGSIKSGFVDYMTYAADGIWIGLSGTPARTIGHLAGNAPLDDTVGVLTGGLLSGSTLTLYKQEKPLDECGHVLEGWYGTTESIDIDLSSLGGGTPGGSDTQVQFNDGGAFGGDADFTFNKATNVLYVNGKIGIGVSPVMPLDVSASVQNIANFKSTGTDSCVYIEAADTSKSSFGQRTGGGTGFFTGQNGFEIQAWGGTDAIASFKNDFKVGIHTGSPQTYLHVLSAGGNSLTTCLMLQGGSGGGSAGSSLVFTSQNSAAWITGRIGAISNRWGTDYGSSMVFYTNSGAGVGTEVERMRITHTGDVGIGTTAPAFEFAGTGLHVKNASGVAHLKVEGTTAALQMVKSSGGTWHYGVDSTGLFAITETAVVERLVIKKTTGNVGIGTTGPDAKLEINSGPATGGIRLSYNDANGSAAVHADLQVDSYGNLLLSSTSGLTKTGGLNVSGATAAGYVLTDVAGNGTATWRPPPAGGGADYGGDEWIGVDNGDDVIYHKAAVGNHHQVQSCSVGIYGSVITVTNVQTQYDEAGHQYDYATSTGPSITVPQYLGDLSDVDTYGSYSGMLLALDGSGQWVACSVTGDDWVHVAVNSDDHQIVFTHAGPISTGSTSVDVMDGGGASRTMLIDARGHVVSYKGYGD